MNARIPRRELLRIGAFAAPVAAFFFPGLPSAVQQATAAPDPTPTLGDPDPNYFGGHVITVTAEGLVLESRQLGQRAIRVASAASIWRGGPVPLSEIRVGDRVDAYGEALPDGSLRASQISANIARFDGVLLRVGQGTALLSSFKTRAQRRLQFAPGIEVLGPEGQLEPAGLSSFGVGDTVGGVALRLPDGTLLVTRAWRTMT